MATDRRKRINYNQLKSPQKVFLEKNGFEPLNRSERRVLGLVLRNGLISQAALKQEMDVTQQTVSRTVTGLVERGYLATKGRASEGRRGQPSITLELVPDVVYSVGFTIMADTVSFAVMDFSGSVIHEDQYEMPSMRPQAVMKICQDIYHGAVTYQSLDPSRIVGIGVAVTGYFVAEKLGFNTPPTIPEWAFVDVESKYSNEFNLPVWAENDGNAAAIGEAMIGVGRWARNFAYLYISSGIGGGIIMDGKLMRGDLGNAGEFGGILPYNVYPHPTLELLRHLVCAGGKKIDSIFQLVNEFDEDWPGVDEWVHKTHAAYSLIASAAAAVLDCTAIVFGGRMPTALARRLIPLIEFYSEARRSVARPTPRVVPAEAEGEVTAIGAAALPLKALYFG